MDAERMSACGGSGWGGVVGSWRDMKVEGSEEAA
jgi:hypothetical protein